MSKEEALKIDSVRLCFFDRARMFAELLKAFVDKYEDEALDIAKRVTYQRGLRIGKNLVEGLREEGKNPKDLRNFVIPIGGTSLFKREIIKNEENIKEWHTLYCPWIDVLRVVGFPIGVGCDVLHHVDKGVADAMGYKMWSDQGLTRGKPYCHFIWESV